MRMRWWLPAAVSAIALIVIAAGCSKKDKGTSARDMTPEEQFATFERFTGGVDALGALSVPLVSSSAGQMFWDGVQEDDTPDFGLGFLSMLNFGGFSRPGIDGLIPAPLGKRTAGDRGKLEGTISKMLRAAVAQSGGYEYDPARGWWIADLDTSMSLSLSDEGTTLQIAISTKLRDSVRFDNTLSEQPTEQPDETTDRLRHGSKIKLIISLSVVSGDTIDVNLKKLEVNLSGLNSVVGLDETTLTLTGNSTFGASIDLTATMPDTLPGNLLISASVKGTAGLTAGANGVTMDMSSEPCPTAGALNAGLTLDIAASSNGESEKAKGSWDMTIDFTGGGNAHVTVESGAFSNEATGQVCQPPLQ